MSGHTTKAELLNAIQKEHTRLENMLSRIPREHMTRPGVVGEWSVRDLLAHLTAWEHLFLRWYGAGQRGETVDPAPVGMSRKAIDTLNARIYSRNRRRPIKDVRAEFDVSFQEILAAVRAMPEQELFTRGTYAWTGKLTLADYAAGNTCNHYRWAAGKLRRWFAMQQAV